MGGKKRRTQARIAGGYGPSSTYLWLNAAAHSRAILLDSPSRPSKQSMVNGHGSLRHRDNVRQNIRYCFLTPAMQNP